MTVWRRRIEGEPNTGDAAINAITPAIPVATKTIPLARTTRQTTSTDWVVRPTLTLEVIAETPRGPRFTSTSDA
jgi:hypothetical protein